MAFDVPLWSVLETSATLYQNSDRPFHLLMTEPRIEDPVPNGAATQSILVDTCATPRLLWLELSTSRVIMTMQGNGAFSYRHFWEQGVYGISRYWLQQPETAPGEQLRLRNYTRSLSLDGYPIPHRLRVEYELWTGNQRLGHYVLNLELQD